MDQNTVISQAICEIIHEGYKNYITNHLTHSYKQNPNSFRLLDKSNVIIKEIEITGDFLALPEHNLLFIYETNANFSFQSFDYKISSSEKYIQLFEETLDLEVFLKSFYQMEFNISPQNIIFEISQFNHYTHWLANEKLSSQEEYVGFIKSNERLFNNFSDIGRVIAIHEAKKYKEHISFQSSYYAKNAIKYAYSLLDLDPLITKVNDEDFEYQLNEAVAAYDNSLYMASCATLGVCIETVCKIILKRQNIKLKDSDATMLDKLAEKLRSHRLITKKDHDRIAVSYKIRNLASHTSPGQVVQNDCHFLINTIHDLVTKYL